jgi:hypothetical protein
MNVKHNWTWQRLILALVAASAWMTLSHDGVAQTGGPFQIVITDMNTPGPGPNIFPKGAVIAVSPENGTRRVLSSGGLFVNPMAIAIDKNRNFVVTDFDSLNGHIPRIIRVNRSTGVQTLVSSGGILTENAGIAIGQNGDILVVDCGCGVRGGPGGLIVVDPISGSQTLNWVRLFCV